MSDKFTIEAEVRLFVHWHSSATSEQKESVNDLIGSIASRLDEPVCELARRLIDAGDNASLEKPKIFKICVSG